MKRNYLLLLLALSTLLFSCSTLKTEKVGDITITQSEEREASSPAIIEKIEKSEEKEEEKEEEKVVVEEKKEDEVTALVSQDFSSPSQEDLSVTPNEDNTAQEIATEDSSDSNSIVDDNLSKYDSSLLLDNFNYAYGFNNMESIKNEQISLDASYFVLGLYDATLDKSKPRFFELYEMQSVIDEFVVSYYQKGISFPSGERPVNLSSLLALTKPDNIPQLFSYAYGFSIVSDLLNGEVDILFYPFSYGMLDSLYSSTPLLDENEREEAIDNYIIYLNEEYYLEIEALKEENKIKAKDFLDKNSKEDGILILNDGVQILPLGADETLGNKPTQYDTVIMDYNTYYVDYETDSLEIFDASVNAEVSVINLPKGLQTALTEMRVGEAIRAFIPPEVSEMEEGDDVVPPYSVIVYDIALQRIL